MIVPLRPLRPPQQSHDILSAIVTWLDDVPAAVIADMKLLKQQREEANDLLSRADVIRGELNQEISAANAREELLNGRESALRKREAALDEAENKLRALIRSL